MWQNSDWFYLDWGSSGLSFVFSQKRFCSSHLWLRQALASGTFPAALQEGDFIVPGDTLHCNDSRRNYTDFQETSQWLGGPAVPKAILSNLCGSLD